MTGALPLMVGVALLLAGCGGASTHQGPARHATTPAQATEPGSTATGTQTQGTATQPRAKTAPNSPEQQPGGAGDEQPARVPASFTGRGGSISPRTVHVPPYIAVLVTLRSSDGRSYELRFPGTLVRVGPGKRTDSALLGGLHPGRSVSGAQAGGGTVRIVANAEPGP